MEQGCSICDRINEIQAHINPYSVAELNTGYVVIGDVQFFRGYTLFLCKQHANELHQLDPSFKLRFLEEMSLVSQAVFETFNPVKLNYELLGNGEPHLHWHLFPRHHDDPLPKLPLWLIDYDVRYAEKERPDEGQLHSLKRDLLVSLKRVASDHILSHYNIEPE
jgi:diadenosine tetraphosphate (Ap4A) HIT family hydrolase